MRMLRPWLTLITFVVSVTGAWGQVTLFGYAGTAGSTSNFAGAIASAGIPVNFGLVDFPDIWTSTNLASITSDFQSRGMKTALFLDRVLFIATADSTSPCLVPLPPYGDLGPGRLRLRGNWQTRLANFAATNGAHIAPVKTAFLVIHAEVNNSCIYLDQVQTAATAVKSYFPGIPTVMGYGRTHVAGTAHVAKPAPIYFPSAIDWVAIWSYGMFDLEDPNNPNNANNITGEGPDFYNPMDRRDPTTTYGDLLGKLQMHQKVAFVMEAQWQTGLHGYLGWPKWMLQYVARNTHDWAIKQPEVVALVPFLWPSPDSDPADNNGDGLNELFLGTANLPQAIRDAHAEIGAAIVP